MFAYSVQFKGEVHPDNIWVPDSEMPRYLFVKPTAYSQRSFADKSMYLIEVSSLDQAIEFVQKIKGNSYDPQVPQPRRNLSYLR